MHLGQIRWLSEQKSQKQFETNISQIEKKCKQICLTSAIFLPHKLKRQEESSSSIFITYAQTEAVTRFSISDPWSTQRRIIGGKSIDLYVWRSGGSDASEDEGNFCFTCSP